MRLQHSVDAISEKSEKYIPHTTKVIKLVNPFIRKRLLALAKDESNEENAEKAA